MSNPADIIANYVGRVAEMQQTRAEQLSEEDLKSIAQELGLQPEDIAYAEQAAAEHVQRATNYLKNQMCSDAIDELSAAVMLRPLSADILCMLAQAYAARWESSSQPADRDEADRMARQVLLIDPDNQDAYTLRKTLQPASGASVRPSRGRGLGTLMLAGAALVLVVGGGALAIGVGSILFLTVPESIPPAVSPIVADQDPSAVVAQAQDGPLALTVVPATAFPDAALVPVLNSLSVYNGSWSYKVNGRLHNQSAAVITEVKGRVVVYDSEGAEIEEQAFDAQRGYNVPLRPGEMHGFDVLIYHDGAGPAPATAALVVDHVEQETAAASYPPDTPVTLQWADGSRPPGVSLSAALRSSRYSPHLLDQKLFHRAEYVITVDEGSASVSLLKLRLDPIDAAGAVTGESDESYVLSSTEPAMEPGESRSVAFLSYQAEQPQGIQVTVIEAR